MGKIGVMAILNLWVPPVDRTLLASISGEDAQVVNYYILAKAKYDHICHDISLKLGLPSFVASIDNHISLPLPHKMAATHVILSRQQINLHLTMH